MQVTMLGTGGPLSTDRRCLGMVVTAANCEPLLIDTCGGFELAGQLAAARFDIDTLRNVIVTHRHLDHAGGMQALILRDAAVEVHALADTHDGIEAVKRGCFPEWGSGDKRWVAEPRQRRHDIDPGDVREIGGFRVEFFAVEHRVPTVAVRVTHGQKTLVFSADCRPGDNLLAAARDADLFLCDALYAERDGERSAEQCHRLMHPSAKQAGETARTAGVGVLALVHSAANSKRESVLEEAAEHFGGPTSLPADLARICV